MVCCAKKVSIDFKYPPNESQQHTKKRFYPFKDAMRDERRGKISHMSKKSIFFSLSFSESAVVIYSIFFSILAYGV